MGSALVPLVVGVLGAVLYFGSNSGKMSEVGRIAFFCGLFWVVYLLARTSIHF